MYAMTPIAIITTRSRKQDYHCRRFEPRDRWYEALPDHAERAHLSTNTACAQTGNEGAQRHLSRMAARRNRRSSCSVCPLGRNEGHPDQNAIQCRSLRRHSLILAFLPVWELVPSPAPRRRC